MDAMPFQKPARRLRRRRTQGDKFRLFTLHASMDERQAKAKVDVAKPQTVRCTEVELVPDLLNRSRKDCKNKKGLDERHPSKKAGLRQGFNTTDYTRCFETC
ncbi:hypothetical protein RB195_010330 [Necator americanus]|uniref:Uncharacterized protein n=1 Tax=Necator americanus TaxID=51031 RepID=A0ABR1CXG3_NECAM